MAKDNNPLDFEQVYVKRLITKQQVESKYQSAIWLYVSEIFRFTHVLYLVQYDNWSEMGLSRSIL